MITGDEPAFPTNVVDLLELKMLEIDPDDTQVVKRPVDPMDQDQTIGITPVDWSPDRRSMEMGKQANPKEETIQRYTIMIQGLINDSENELAIKRHAIFSTLIRRMVYRDRVLQLALPQLSVEIGGVREAMHSWGINSQRWMVNRREGSFIYMSALEFWFETTNTPI